MQPVNSSQIAKIGYDEPTNTLAIEFKNNGTDKDGNPRPNSTYHYGNVTPEAYENLMAAESIGRHHRIYIKEHPGKFPYVKIS